MEDSFIISRPIFPFVLIFGFEGFVLERNLADAIAEHAVTSFRGTGGNKTHEGVVHYLCSSNNFS